MHLTVIAKQPVAGRVKTRLCPPCTPEQAAEVAAAALADTFDTIIDAARHHGLRPVALYDGEPGDWIPDGLDAIPQRGDGLGERLANGFEDLGPGLVVGMDTPAACRGLGPGIGAVRAGIDTLGLALDGGYWVIGLHSVDRRVFDGVPMSAGNTGIAQLAALHRLGRQVRLLAMARDLDHVADLWAATTGEGRLADVARRLRAENG